MTRKRIDPDLAQKRSAFEDFPVIEEAYPIVAVPTDVKASIARAEAAIQAASQSTRTSTAKAPPSIFEIAVTDQDVQDARDKYLDKLELAARGRRQQPPMVDRLRAVIIVAERMMVGGIPFAVGPNSKMNRMVRNWLNTRAGRTKDDRKSRRKQITAEAVRVLLRKVRPHLSPTDD